jgi:hypothetical protein
LGDAAVNLSGNHRGIRTNKNFGNNSVPVGNVWLAAAAGGLFREVWKGDERWGNKAAWLRR